MHDDRSFETAACPTHLHTSSTSGCMLGLRPQLKPRPSLLDLVSKTATSSTARPSTPLHSELDEDDERPPPYEVPLPDSPQHTRSRQLINPLSSPADANPSTVLKMPPVSPPTLVLEPSWLTRCPIEAEPAQGPGSWRRPVWYDSTSPSSTCLILTNTPSQAPSSPFPGTLLEPRLAPTPSDEHTVPSLSPRT